MQLRQSSTTPMKRPKRRAEPGMRQPRTWLGIARLALIGIALPVLALYVASIPSYFAYLHVLSPAPVSEWGGQISLKDLQTLQVVGLSLDFYAWFNAIANILFFLVFALVGVMIFWRKSDDRMALLASFTLVIFPVENELIMLQTLPSSWGLLVQLVDLISSVSIYLFFYLFPSGRFDRRWIGWFTAIMVLYEFGGEFFLPSSSSPFLFVLNNVMFITFTVAILVVQIYRYRRLSTPIERQQTKWVVFGSAIGVAGYIVGIFVVELLLHQVLHVGMLPYMVGYTVADFFLCCVPVSIAIAILRSRLWDIDIIINRTLVYATLTISLAAIYFGLVIGLGALVRLITGQLSQSPVVIVVSTLIIAALFQPFRRRIQAIIDRRFYRKKYDAQKTLATFSASLRDEVDLQQVQENLLAVVEETMQPAHISLWVRPTQPDGKQGAAISRSSQH